MKIFEKFIIPGGEKYFSEITVPNVCSHFTQSLYLIMCWTGIVFKDMDLTTDKWTYKISCLMFSH